MVNISSSSVEQTKQCGRKLGKLLKPGDVVCVIGELGAGKTAFVSGIADALCIDKYITSPTFTIVNEYYGTIPLYHFDVYRIKQPQEMYDIGYEEYINGDGVCVIEWANMIKSILPPQYWEVNITRKSTEPENYRLITIKGAGIRSCPF